MNSRSIKIAVLLASVILMLALVSCGGSPESSDNQNPVQPEESSDEAVQDEANGTAADEADENALDKTLVVYFSVTGNTKRVAEIIAEETGADIHEIVPAKKYTDEDIDWNNDESRTTIEQNDNSARPEIAGDDIDLSQYSTIYIGYPIWHGQEPRIMDTFVESHDFSDKKVVPFCTSGSSGIGNSGTNLEQNAGNGEWLSGQRFSGGASEDEIRTWIDGLDG